MNFLSKLKSALRLPPAEPPLISVVLQFRQPMLLPEEALHAAVTRAWGRDTREDLNEHIVNRPPICFVKFDGMMLALSNAKRPYCPPELLDEALSEFPEMRQKKVVKEHRAFLAIDLQYPKAPRKSEKNDCYRRMCRFAAEFVDANCMGVYLPETRHMRPYDEDVVKALRSERPLQELENWGNPPMSPIENDDPRLLAAVAEARLRWPEFLLAFQRRNPNQTFSVKAAFTDGEQTEWMWVVVSSIHDGMLDGNLGNAPVDIRNVHEGDRVTVRTSEIGDWVYQDGTKLIGGFSLTSPEG